VDQVADGEAALTHVANGSYEMIILDCMLPGMDGLEVCRRIRQTGSRLPVLMLTARAEVSDRIAGLDAGADDYLPKPFDLGELLARTRALSRRASGGEPVTRVGSLTIDRGERKASIDGRKLDLTPREFALLAFLAREAGKVAPKMEILQKVWEMSFDPGSNVIEVHVKNLREKLGTDAKMIETVRGVGYRLVAPGEAPKE
jgi:two-component system, OmpR family, response regulator